jgi:hypothetical protein
MQGWLIPLLTVIYHSTLFSTSAIAQPTQVPSASQQIAAAEQQHQRAQAGQRSRIRSSQAEGSQDLFERKCRYYCGPTSGGANLPA